MDLKIYTLRELFSQGHLIRPDFNKEEYMNSKWVSVDELLNKINNVKDDYFKKVEFILNDFFEFLEADIWHASTTEWKKELDMLEYLNNHFEIVKKKIKDITK